MIFSASTTKQNSGNKLGVHKCTSHPSGLSDVGRQASLHRERRNRGILKKSGPIRAAANSRRDWNRLYYAQVWYINITYNITLIYTSVSVYALGLGQNNRLWQHSPQLLNHNPWTLSSRLQCILQLLFQQLRLCFPPPEVWGDRVNPLVTWPYRQWFYYQLWVSYPPTMGLPWFTSKSHQKLFFSSREIH